MTTTLEQLKTWMDGREDEHIEFKEAKNQLDFDNLVSYCVALANERGGKLVLGVTDKRPRHVVGSRAFANLGKIQNQLLNRLQIRIDADEVSHPSGRVVVFHVPSRPLGSPLSNDGRYLMRSGKSLVSMTPDVLRRIFSEAEAGSGLDYSAEVCESASWEDLDAQAIERFRSRWAFKSGRTELMKVPAEQLLVDVELIVNGHPTLAALILLGTPQAVGRLLPQSEVVFEYRSSEASGPAQQRLDFRQGFFCFDDELWNTINLRNDRHHYQQGFIVWDVATFNETVVREAVLNAVSHRDYRTAGSVFVRQLARRLEITSPGGLPAGITLDNILYRQAPRNRRICYVFARCGLVERSGQGMNRMFEGCVRESKPLPDFSGTDDYQVMVTLRGEVEDARFIQYLQKIGEERLASFATDDFLVLDLVRREQRIPDRLRDCARALVDHGALESVGRGRGQRFVLSRGLYGVLGEPGVYTRRRGLDRDANKELLLKHIRDSGDHGSPLSELQQVVPYLSRRQVQVLLGELRKAGLVHATGQTRSARWHSGKGAQA